MSDNCKLQLVCGRSGYGKTTFLCKQMIEKSIAHADSHFFMVVPEQFTMGMQKKLTDMHPDGGIINIDVLNFGRLSHHIFEELHIPHNQVLDDIGKTMVIGHLLDVHKKELCIYGKSANKPGFHEEMKSMISELFQYGVSKDDVLEAMKKLDNNAILYMKLKDLVLIYEAFEDYIRENYVVAEQMLTMAGDVIGESRIFRNATIYFDGFTGFTPVQYVFLEKLVKVVNEIKISICMPKLHEDYKKEHHLFHMSYEMYMRLMKLATDVREIELEDTIYLDEGLRFNSQEIAHLEQNIFTYPYKKWQTSVQDITLISVKSAREELKWISSEIRRLIIEKGYRYKDFGIVTADLTRASYLAEEVFPDYEIPYFIDSNVGMIKYSFTKWLLSAWRIISYGYQYEDVFSYLKSGYSKNIKSYQVGKLENYALRRGLRSARGWEKKSENKAEEEARATFVEEMDTLKKAIHGKTVRAYVEALYTFCDKLNVEYKLECQAEDFEKNGEFSLARVYSQIYGKTLELFDKMVDILGEKEISRESFLHILEIGMDSLSVGILPPGIDQVAIGDIERTRLGDIKVLFFMNVNDGVVPKNGVRGMVLTDKEREQLMEQENLCLAPTLKKRNYQEQFYLYLNMTKPSHRLYISYQKLNAENGENRPSYLVNRLQLLFPSMRVLDVDRIDVMDRIYSKDVGATAFAQMIRDYISEQSEGSQSASILSVLQRIYENTEEEAMIKQGIQYPLKAEALPEDVTMQLYGSNAAVSASRLEKYAGCAYAFFLQYGLRLQEKKLFEVTVADTGSILHSVLEQVFAYYKSNNMSIRNVNKQECLDKAREIFNLVANQEDYRDIFADSKRSTHMRTTIERVAIRSMDALYNHLKAGTMNPEAFELKFGDSNSHYASFTLNNSIKMELKGVVDRVDLFVDHDEDKVYVQVIDYKSGDKDIDYTKLYYGTQIQLGLYMNVVRNWVESNYPNKKIVPVGMYYFHMQDPLLDSNPKKTVEELREKEMRLKGLTIDEDDIVQKVDNGPGSVIYASRNGDGSLSARSKVVTETYYDSLLKHVNNKVKELGNRIYEGDIDIDPYAYKDEKACTYCKFSGICMFDATCHGMNYQRWDKKEKEVFANELDTTTTADN